VTTCSFPISGGDYDRAGTATRSFKEVVRALGVDADTMRRVMIAAYEAEMNVVIHAHRGHLRAVVSPDRIDAEVVDEGPGIPDIQRAMTEGFSTACAAARALGFGAGMGLPNIRKQSDEFILDSQVGVGTRLRFSVRIGRRAVAEPVHNSLWVRGERCVQCGRCVLACPTGAVRMRHGGVSVLAHLCVQCTECAAVCQRSAIGVEGDDLTTSGRLGALVAPPAALFVGGDVIGERTVDDAVTASGYASVELTVAWESELRRSVIAYATGPRPTISPVCSAVVELVRVRFPGLAGSLAPFATPLESAAAARADADVVPLCAAARTGLLASGVRPERLLGPVALRRRIMATKAAHPREAASTESISPPPPSGGAERPVVVVSGMRQVIHTLEALEEGRVQGPAVLELYACHGGCFGSALTGETCAALAEHAFRGHPRSAERREVTLVAVPQRLPRHGYRLDDDMGEALRKLAAIGALLTRLPGDDCAECGAPTCRAFAEDVVLARVAEKACPRRTTQGPTP
jgi:anti-sigma regulatory factor (Ser/Thr protein kinase)